ncbi:NinG protein [Dysgonomonas alginatilytica]|uniref:NinG protein n=1 Tax=Dysgonomonas alginatilytica TaxID=1605892 RepID=A0A2V3PK50_9BACT|nr:NinG protein [Dysgonomonas alginatilytica]
MPSPNKVKEADNILSRFIRLFYSKDGYVSCFTCGKAYRISEMQNGHFIPRGNMTLRFSIMNCFPQCKECNEYKDGNEAKYREALTEKFGIAHVEYLDKKKNVIKHWTDFELDELIQKLKTKVKTMEKTQ